MAKAREPFKASGWFVPMIDADFDGICFIDEIVMDDNSKLSIIRHGASLPGKDIVTSGHVYFRQIGNGDLDPVTYPLLIFELHYMRQPDGGTPWNITNSSCINREGYTLQEYCRDYLAGKEIGGIVKRKAV